MNTMKIFDFQAFIFQRKMDKKGFELMWNTTVRLVLSVLALIILAYLLGKVIFGIGNDETKNAEKELEKIVNQIESVEDETSLIIHPPENWFLRSDGLAEINHADCIRESCLCFCEGPSCNGLIVCEGFDIEVVVEGSYTETMDILVEGALPDTIEFENVIEFENPSAKLRIFKQDEKIKIQKVAG